MLNYFGNGMTAPFFTFAFYLSRCFFDASFAFD